MATGADPRGELLNPDPPGAYAECRKYPGETHRPNVLFLNPVGNDRYLF
jgi:hypothetical protein